MEIIASLVALFFAIVGTVFAAFFFLVKVFLFCAFLYLALCAVVAYLISFLSPLSDWAHKHWVVLAYDVALLSIAVHAWINKDASPIEQGLVIVAQIVRGGFMLNRLNENYGSHYK